MDMQQAHKRAAQRDNASAVMPPLAATQSVPALQRMAAALNQSPQVTQLQAQATNLQNGLPAGLKNGVQSLSGMAMDHVKVHYNSAKPAQLNAHAYTQGSDIHVAPGQEQHLAHEAWHVVQQAQGRVQPTTQLAGTHINDDQSLESEADHMGARALGLGGDHGPAVPVQNKANTGAMVAQLRNNTEISYQQGTLTWRATNNVAHALHQQVVGLATSAFIDPEDPEQGERTGAPANPSIYTTPPAGLYANANGGHNLTQGHLLNANLGGKAQPFNLFPITAEMNRAHSDVVEDPVKFMVLRVNHERQLDLSHGGGAFVPAGNAIAANRAAEQALPAAHLGEVQNQLPGVIAAVNGVYGGAAPPGVAAVLAGVPALGDNPASVATIIINAAGAVAGAMPADVLNVAGALAGALGGAVAAALGGVLPAALGVGAAADAATFVAAIGGGGATPAGLAGTMTATPNDISEAFRAHPGGGVALPGAPNWGNVRVFYSVRADAPGVNGAGVMQPNNFRQEQFHCLAYYTTNDGITPNLALPHIQADIQAPHDLNGHLAGLGFAPAPAPAGLVVGPAIAAGGGGGGGGAPNAPSQHNVLDAFGNIVGHATLFDHG